MGRMGGGEPHQMGSHVYGAKRCEEREKRGREEAALPGSHRNSRDSHIPWKWSMVRASSLTGRAEEKRRSKEKGLPVWEGDHNRSVLRGELISLET